MILNDPIILLSNTISISLNDGAILEYSPK